MNFLAKIQAEPHASEGCLEKFKRAQTSEELVKSKDMKRTAQAESFLALSYSVCLTGD